MATNTGSGSAFSFAPGSAAREAAITEFDWFLSHLQSSLQRCVWGRPVDFVRPSQQQVSEAASQIRSGFLAQVWASARKNKVVRATAAPARALGPAAQPTTGITTTRSFATANGSRTDSAAETCGLFLAQVHRQAALASASTTTATGGPSTNPAPASSSASSPSLVPSPSPTGSPAVGLSSPPSTPPTTPEDLDPAQTRAAFRTPVWRAAGVPDERTEDLAEKLVETWHVRAARGAVLLHWDAEMAEAT
ncbi:hypothetical protein NEMBOFW57_004654 [Staphylotrichum longicolle]|uniref:Uncharacterized protein n=1 Tax=Staphylotrichum longicolle TaxID=669026 RepID=A0AAD4FC35_9PEZI|nr:hypothetical protein NEMBOFW57_004654 [Staphylotrichum longicolle]